MSLFISIELSVRSIFRKAILGLAMLTVACQATGNKLSVHHLGDGQSLLKITEQKKYILLPIEEASPESRLSMVCDNEVIQTLNVRLAVTKTDYYVPIDLSGHRNISFNFHSVPDDAICWQDLKLSDNYDTVNKESYRPAYHFSPSYGWMNDPNGMVYKNGEFHLFYQYNPYGSMWGNMHWGHAVSKNMIDWEELPVALAPDGLGSIFSGSCVVDKKNTAGFGEGAIIAFYTSAGERQVQSMAYSQDNGRTFKKYERNPIITSTVRDFRDPKVFWHPETDRWIMVIAASQEMQFYSSPNLREWTYESSFGHGEGNHDGVWECPDLIRLPIDGSTQKKWVLLCNINPGGPFGGSATQYFIGEFNGKKFINDFPATTKWMDWGKDHYATVTWSNAPDNRNIAIGWMSNWQYANQVPTTQYRSANTLPRDLSLYKVGKELYIRCAPAPEVTALRKKGLSEKNIRVNNSYNISSFLPQDKKTYEIALSIKNESAEIIGWSLFNSKGEEIKMYYNLIDQTFSMDRTKSGITGFSEEFPTVTVAPIYKDAELNLRIFVDNSSIEVFGNEGCFVMTNLVFPTEPYTRLSFYAKGGSYEISSLNVYPIK